MLEKRSILVGLALLAVTGAACACPSAGQGHVAGLQSTDETASATQSAPYVVAQQPERGTKEESKSQGAGDSGGSGGSGAGAGGAGGAGGDGGGGGGGAGGGGR
jgi:hypothetical protein